MAYRTRAHSNEGLVAGLSEAGIVRTRRVQDAMRATDRGCYCPTAAYVDTPQTIGHGQTISAPHMHAECLELLEPLLGEGERVLDVGCGSGYLTACMARMVGARGKVVGIDIVPELVELARENVARDDAALLESGVVELKVANGWEGDAANAPFSCIHVGAAAASLPQPLVDQLAPGGKLVIPVGTANQELMMYVKGDDGGVTPHRLMGVRYVPLVQER